MKIGFLILSYKKQDTILALLLKQLGDIPEREIVIHHDFDQEKDFVLSVKGDYISLVTPSYRTYWSHLNNVLATLDGLRLLYHKGCDWVVTLTPQCLPIVSIKTMLNFFSMSTYDAYIHMHRVKEKKWGVLDDYLSHEISWQPWIKIPFISRKGKFYWRLLRKKIPTEKNPFVNGAFEYMQGSNYFALSGKAISKIIAADSTILTLIRFYKEEIKALPDMHPCPQETIIQTFLGSQPDLKICLESLHYINWKDSDKDWSPKELDLDDLSAIQESNFLFARKFSIEKSALLIEALQRRMDASIRIGF